MMTTVSLPPFCSNLFSASFTSFWNFFSCNLLLSYLSKYIQYSFPLFSMAKTFKYNKTLTMLKNIFKCKFKYGPTASLNCIRAFKPAPKTSSFFEASAFLMGSMSLGKTAIAFSSASWVSNKSRNPACATNAKGCCVSFRPF